MQVNLTSETVSWADFDFKWELTASLNSRSELLLIALFLSLLHSLEIHRVLSLLSKISFLLKSLQVIEHMQ